MTLSDITKTSQSEQKLPIDLVGMENVEIPVKYKNTLQPATHNIFVSLDDEKAKGIHMSRIFLITKNELEDNDLSFKVLSKITQEFLESQNGKSSTAKIETHFNYIKKYPSLLSNNIGWRYYPASFKCTRKKKETIFEASVQVTYSSTCPCSAGLSRQKIQEKFLRNFSDKNPSKEVIHEWLGTEAAHPPTPHSQRSHAFINVTFESLKEVIELDEIINIAEEAIKTPVQSVVKREDEQKFAELNGENLLFTEDAVRRIAKALENKNLRNFSVTVEHQESLHPHNAVATITKNSHT